MAVLEEAGEPARVRNDFRRTTWSTPVRARSTRAGFERFVTETYGRKGVPAPSRRCSARG